LYEGIFLGTGAGFHHPEYALHQFGSFSTIQCHLPITGASTLSQGHETALSLWSPSPSKKNPSITTPGQRLSPTALPSDITSWQPRITRAVTVFLALLWLCCPVVSAFSGASAVLPPVTSPEMIICCLISQCFIWWPSQKSLGKHRDPINEAIKQSSDWDHSTNLPYLFSKLSPGPCPGFHQT